MRKIMINYQRTNEIDSFIYAKFPKAFINADPYKKMSCDAKVLYMQLLDSTNISRKNDWIDDNGRLYVKQTQETMAKDINCGIKKVRRILNELVENNLIDINKTGPNKPDMIFVSDLSEDLKSRNLTKYLVKDKNHATKCNSSENRQIVNELQQVNMVHTLNQNDPEMVSKEPVNQKIKTNFNKI